MMTLELGGRLPTIQVSLEKCSLSRFIVYVCKSLNLPGTWSLPSPRLGSGTWNPAWDIEMQICCPGWVQGSHGGDQDRFCGI